MQILYGERENKATPQKNKKALYHSPLPHFFSSFFRFQFLFSFRLPSSSSDHRKKKWCHCPNMEEKQSPLIKLLNYILLHALTYIFIPDWKSQPPWSIPRKIVKVPACKILKELHDLLGVAQRVGCFRLLGDGRNDYRVPLSPTCYHLESFTSLYVRDKI